MTVGLALAPNPGSVLASKTASTKAHVSLHVTVYVLLSVKLKKTRLFKYKNFLCPKCSMLSVTSVSRKNVNIQLAILKLFPFTCSFAE